jgi:hypothetical protein
MKKNILMLLVALTSSISYSQSCCQLAFASNEGNMAEFTNDESFILKARQHKDKHKKLNLLTQSR